MKLQLEAYKKKYIVETQHDDLGLYEYFDLFKGLLMSSGWHQSTIEEYIIELANELKDA
jgi:hypothetical protein